MPPSVMGCWGKLAPLTSDLLYDAAVIGAWSSDAMPEKLGPVPLLQSSNLQVVLAHGIRYRPQRFDKQRSRDISPGHVAAHTVPHQHTRLILRCSKVCQRGSERMA